MAEEWLTTREVAAILRVNVTTIRKMIHAGKMRARRVGRRWRIPRTEVLPPKDDKR